MRFLTPIFQSALSDQSQVRSLISQQKGQALLEALLTMSLCIPLASLLLALAYFVYVKNQVEYIGYESLVCRISFEPKNKNQCTQELRKKLSKALPFGQISQLSFSKSGEEQRLRIIFHLSPHGWGENLKWIFQKSINPQNLR